jgi:hypothetical protein
MAILIFVLSFILLVAGGVSGYASLDLLPTGPGLLYALAGAVGVSAAIVTFALGVAIGRMDRLVKLLRSAPVSRSLASPVVEDLAPFVEARAPSAEAFAAPLAAEASGPPLESEDESPININRSGHLPTLDGIETVLEAPVTPPALVGRYSSAGATYKIFDDGSIEAETNEGTFKFASMTEFKRHLIETKRTVAAAASESQAPSEQSAAS